jgi:hypothetical protein
MKKLLVENLEANNCSIMLNKAESLFLTESLINLIENDNFNIKAINKIIENFQKNSDVSYFSNKDINSISKNLLKNLKKN